MRKTTNTTKHILLSVIFCCILAKAQSQNAEKVIKAYFSGYEKKDCNLLTSQLAEGFTFTSPNGDDHLTLAEYKERCWRNNRYFKQVTFPKIVVDGNSAFAM